ncbi:MAG TPA: hypothetical protein VGJ57_07340 [Nitrospirales bacterium]
MKQIRWFRGLRVGFCMVMAIGCAGPSSRMDDYLIGFQPVSGAHPIALPLLIGVVIALPEEELARPTTPSKEALEKIGQRIEKELQESPHIKVRRIFPTIIIPAGGLGALSVERVRDSVKDRDVSKVIVAVATSRPARRVYFSRVEDQLFARMDAALVDLTTNQVLQSENGQDDYVLAQSYFYNEFSYPRLYYRTFTFAGPFTVVEGNPFKALGEMAFSGAADQLGMKFRRLIDPTPLS